MFVRVPEGTTRCTRRPYQGQTSLPVCIISCLSIVLILLSQAMVVIPTRKRYRSDCERKGGDTALAAVIVMMVSRCCCLLLFCHTMRCCGAYAFTGASYPSYQLYPLSPRLRLDTPGIHTVTTSSEFAERRRILGKAGDVLMLMQVSWSTWMSLS